MTVYYVSILGESKAHLSTELKRKLIFSEPECSYLALIFGKCENKDTSTDLKRSSHILAL